FSLFVFVVDPISLEEDSSLIATAAVQRRTIALTAGCVGNFEDQAVENDDDLAIVGCYKGSKIADP
ncbi:hypothetical protein A2U01_0007407, partial [Trifolium medium]|nr:hypothetical protein [Trifolium medium]